MKRTPVAIVILVVILGLLLPVDALAEFTGLPPGFRDDPFVSDVQQPIAIDWLPDGDILITEKSGDLLRAGPDGQGLTDLNLPIDVCNVGEGGLLGVAVDPDFGAETGFIFVYYTADEGSDCAQRAHRVSRFSLGPGNVVGAERILIDNTPAPGTNHAGGDLQFDRDGLLYVSVGDGGMDLRTGEGQGENGNARRLDILNGKILRIDRNGNIPAGNPFTGAGTMRCGAPEFDPDDTSGSQRFYINDVGGGAWEEINEGQEGADYGWNLREGPCRMGETRKCERDKRFVNPIFAYKHETTDCQSTTGGAFVPDEGANWPDAYDDSYIYADFVCEKLFRLRTTRQGSSVQEFGVGTEPVGTKAIHLAFGPDGALYYTALLTGEVRKMTYDPD